MVCANMIDRTINNIDCSTFDAEQVVTLPSSLNATLANMSISSTPTSFFEYNTEDGLKIKVNLDSTNVSDDNDTLGLSLPDIEYNTFSDLSHLEETTISEIQASRLVDDADGDANGDTDNRPDRKVFGKELHELTEKVCKAETDSQLLIAAINGYRAPIASIFPIIIILFAGGWSDKKGLRKPCMLFPLIGELLGCIALFISAIFMRQLPMEFGSILEKVLPAMMGGQTLMLMGVYSYLSASTAEEDRTFR